MDIKKKLQKLNSYSVLAEIQLLIGTIPAILFPLLGFVAACIQVRYKSDFNVNCIDLVTDEDQQSSNKFALF